MTATVSKTTPAVPASKEEVVDYEKVVKELMKLVPDIESKAQELIKEFTSIKSVAAKPETTKLSVKFKDEDDKKKKLKGELDGMLDEGLSDVWMAVKNKAKQILDSFKTWGKNYDEKLARIKLMMKPAKQVKEDAILSKLPMKTKNFVKKLKDSDLDEDDVKDIIDALEGQDGDTLLHKDDIAKICKVAKVKLNSVLIAINVMEDPDATVTEAKSETPVKRTQTAFKVDSYKLGTLLLSNKDPRKEVHVGDWVKITKGEHEGEYGYIVGSNKREREDPKDRAFYVDISETKEANKVKVPFDDVKVVKKFHDNEGFGSVAAKAKTQTDKKVAKADNIQDLHYFTASNGESYALAPAATAPNLRWNPDAGVPAAALVVDIKKERTAEDKKKSKAYLKDLEKTIAEYEKAIDERRDRFTKTDLKTVEQTLKNTKAVYAAMVKYDEVVNDFNALSKKLNKAWEDNNEEAFAEGTYALRQLAVSEYSRITKTKQSLPKFISPGRAIAAKGFDYMLWARDNAEKNLKRMRMSDKQKAAADKASVRMKMRWFE